MSLSRKVLESVLACPELHHPLRIATPYTPSSFSYFRCTQVKEPVDYGSEKGIPSLLPRFSVGEKREFKGRFDDFEFEDQRGGRVSLTGSEVEAMMREAHYGDIRALGTSMRNIVEKLPHTQDGKLMPLGAALVARGLAELFLRDYEKLDRRVALRLLGSISMARYQAELEVTGNYRGNFVIPGPALDYIPKESRVLEVAMGNGASLRRISSSRNPSLSIGLDNCLGMVKAAVRLRGSNNSFYAMADAHHLPLADNSMDVTLMFNALDRLQNAPGALEHIRRVSRDGAVIILGQCMPFQYDVSIGDTQISLVDPKDRFTDLGEVVDSIEGAKVTHRSFGIPWHPETVTQGRENLAVDVVVAKLRK